MNLRGKTREEIELKLVNKSRSELIDLIHSLLTIEILLKPGDIANRSCLNKRAVLKDIRDGKFGDYYCRAENSIAVPASGVNKWRRSFLVPVNAACSNPNLATDKRKGVAAISIATHKKRNSQRMNRSSAEGQ